MVLAALSVGFFAQAILIDHDVGSALWFFFSLHAFVACLVAALCLVIRGFF